MTMSEKPVPTLLRCPFCGGNPLMWRRNSTMFIHCVNCGADGPIVNSEEDAIAGWNDRTRDAAPRRDLARAELMHKRTAEHLRQERRRRRLAECANSGLHRQLRAWYGGETITSLFDTPAHYHGDGLVTCRRAMESCESQEKVVEPSRMAFYWWACAFKYVWRMWSKEDPEKDALKAIDCLEKAAGLGRLVAEEREDG